MLWHLQPQQQGTTSSCRKYSWKSNLASVIIVLCKPNINYAVGIFKFVRENFAPILEHLRIGLHHICHVCMIVYLLGVSVAKTKCCKISLSGVLAAIIVALYFL